MADLIEGVDIVGRLVTHLDSKLTVPVASKVRQGGGVTLYDTGGPGFTNGGATDAAQITVDSRAATETAAWRLASDVRTYVRALVGTHDAGPDVFVQRAEELARPQLLPDPDYEGARYRWTVIVSTRTRVR